MKIKAKEKQKGVALFVTLLVVTIATLLATEMWFNNTLDIARQFNNRASYQANHYAKGMLLWANDILKKDYQENSSFDNNTEIWNRPIAGIQLEDAILSGQLSDMNGKFNLNNLFINGEVHFESRAYFIRVLTKLELDVSIVDKIIDWIDPDQVPLQHGAEDSFYLSQNPSYRTAGQYFVHISEIKMVAGINERIFQRLKGFVTVLPIVGNTVTKMNVNTVPTLLIMSLDDRISSQEALALYQNGAASNQKLADFFNQRAIINYNLNQEALKIIIDTKSNWFHAEINVNMGQSNFKKFALISRFSPTPIVVQWSTTPFD